MNWKKHEMMECLTAAGLAKAISKQRLPDGMKPITGKELLNVIAFDCVIDAIVSQVMYLRYDGMVPKTYEGGTYEPFAVEAGQDTCAICVAKCNGKLCHAFCGSPFECLDGTSWRKAGE